MLSNAKQAPNLSKGYVQTTIYKLCQDSEVRIYERYSKDPNKELGLFVKGSSDYIPWLDFIVQTGNDCEPKYYKIIKPPVYIQCPRHQILKLIDIEGIIQNLVDFISTQYTNVQKLLDPEQTLTGSFSNQFPLLARPTDQCFQELLQQRLNGLRDELDNQLAQHSFENMYKQVFQRVNKKDKNLVRARCTTTSSVQNYFGFCEGCKDYGHNLISFATQQDLVNSSRIRVVDVNKMKREIIQEFTLSLQKLILYRFVQNTKELHTQVKEIQDRMFILQDTYTKLQENRGQYIMETENQKKIQEQQQENIKVNYDVDSACKILEPKRVGDTFYDIVISCDSILELTAGKGWDIQIENSQEYDEKVMQNTLVVSFYGLYNKGKTFLASQLSKKQLALGYSISTIGLSALYPKDLKRENAVVFLDTAGTETPICYHKDDNAKKIFIQQLQQDERDLKESDIKSRIYEMKLKDRLLTEHILQRFILSSSNIVLIVVDQLTKEEQRLIQKIKNLYEENHDLIIIHNFSKLVELEDVQKYIESDILNSFEVQKQFREYEDVQLSGFYYVENWVNVQGNKLREITHVIVAHNDSKAGDIYNKFAFHYIKTRILAETRAKKFDIKTQLIQMLKVTIPQIIDIPPDQVQNIEIDIKDNKIITNLNSTALKSVSFDLLGDLKVFKGGLDPKYSITKNENTLTLEVEICGPFSATEHDKQKNPKRIMNCPNSNSIYEWHGFPKTNQDKNQLIIIRGVKVDLQYEQSKQQCLSNNRDKGEFRVTIPINPSKCVLRDGLPELKVLSGVLQFNYQLQSNTEEIDFF